jgi:cyclic pyranopterin phosphate synthase
MLYKHRGNCIIHLKIHHQAVSNRHQKEQFFRTFGDVADEIYIENLIPMWPQFKSQHAVDRFRYGGQFVPKKVCVQMFKGFQIQANGECVPCCVDWKRVNVIGNINKGSIRDVWEGKKLKSLRTAHLKGKRREIEPCQSCTMNDFNEIDNIDGCAKIILKRLWKTKRY